MTVLFELFLKFIASAFFASLALIILFLLVRPLALFSNQSSMSLLSYLMVCLLAVSFVLLFLTPNFVAAVLFAWLRYLFLQSIWRLFDQVHVDWCLANVSLFEREKVPLLHFAFLGLLHLHGSHWARDMWHWEISVDCWRIWNVALVVVLGLKEPAVRK